MDAYSESTGTDPIFSHWSAAALWSLPSLHGWPDVVHLTDDSLAQTRNGRRAHKHATEIRASEIAEVQGRRVTSLVRTAFDLAAQEPFEAALVVMDAVLRGLQQSSRSLEPLVGEYGGHRSKQRIGRVLDFARQESQSVLETRSRLAIRRLGFATPELQRTFRRPSGRRADVDFFWPEAGVVGECDGMGKYFDEGLLEGRTPEQKLREEKDREADLRARPEISHIVRWGWKEVEHPHLLDSRLRAAGVPMHR